MTWKSHLCLKHLPSSDVQFLLKRRQTFNRRTSETPAGQTAQSCAANQLNDNYWSCDTMRIIWLIRLAECFCICLLLGTGRALCWWFHWIKANVIKTHRFSAFYFLLRQPGLLGNVVWPQKIGIILPSCAAINGFTSDIQLIKFHSI